VVVRVREAVAKVSFTFTHDSSDNMLTFTFRISLPALPLDTFQFIAEPGSFGTP
jgi:hypothetical protein